MKIKAKFFFKPLLSIFLITVAYSDSLDYNFYNNHGSVGLINIPTARFFNEGVHGVTIYDGDPEQKITLTSNPYDWLEASFFYMNIEERQLCRYSAVKKYCQGYKDKGFNLKFRLKEEGAFPAIAVGLNDFAGTGFYSSEYIVATYGIGNYDMHFGIGWGQLSGSNNRIKNPFGYLSDSFKIRPSSYSGRGGALNFSQYFSGNKASPFYGISYSYNDKLLFKFEKDTTFIGGPNRLGLPTYPERKSDFSFGLNYSLNKNFSVGLSFERGSNTSFNLTYKNDPKKTVKPFKYKATNQEGDKYTKLISNLENNGIGVNKITETASFVGLELTQFVHSDVALVEQIIKEASRNAGINKTIKKDLKIANLSAISEIDEAFERNASLIYERDTSSFFNTNTTLRFKPFLASREEFFKGAILVENDSEAILRENLFFSFNLKYSLVDNFNDLVFPPLNTFPAQVRSDIKKYLKNIDDGGISGRAQLDSHFNYNKHNKFMLTGVILEDMFSGYDAEYLYFKPNINYSLGFEVFHVKKRDYDWGVGHLDYENTTYSANLYYRNYGLIPFDMKLSFGEYLAGDKGTTMEFSRRFKSGVNFGVFATFTDVSTDNFGEGSFDKGIFFNIPIYGNFINYTWRPLTKDPGAKLVRRNSLHDLLVRFRPLD